MNRTLKALAALMSLLSACGGDAPSGADGAVMDGSSDTGVVDPCARAADCDDGLHCNGEERCEPGAPGADPRGCLGGTDPCDPATETCDETADSCALDECADGGDADGDGDARVACGGGDCDDDDETVYSTAQEVCDADGVDEDCNPETIRDPSAGSTDGDEDLDGFVSDDCFNRRADATENRGRDCDDSRAGVHPGQSDVCGGGDQDCDGRVDEEPSVLYYFDMDGDGYGVNATETNVLACSPPSASYTLLEGDCDETRPGVHPGVPDGCNGLDDDCDGSADPGCACTDGTTQPCGPSTTTGDCARSSRVCTAGSWPMTCPGAVYPGTEVCGGGDEDCDGATDESGASDAMTFYLDSDRDGYGDPARPMRLCATRVGGLPQPHVANDGDCNDGDASVSPSAPEVCDLIDHDCSGPVDDVPGGCSCTNGATQPCGPAEAGTGPCRGGTQTCSGGRWGTCVGAVYPTAEVCNAQDDDCDGMDDDTFACVRGETETGTTMCGHPGSRMCTSSCAWATPFVAAENAATCDYCDDSGMGIGQERPYATASWMHTWPSFPLVLGEASAYGSGQISCEAGVCAWRLASAANDKGAVFLTAPLRLGYAPAEIRGRAQTVGYADPVRGGGYSLLLLPHPAGAHLGGGTNGLPLASRGLAFTWEFAGTDRLSIHRIPGAGAVPVVVDTTIAPSGQQRDGLGYVNHEIVVRLTPDDPITTGVDETAAVLMPGGLSASCANAGASPCGWTLTPGDEIEVGVVGVENATGDATVGPASIAASVASVCSLP